MGTFDTNRISWKSKVKEDTVYINRLPICSALIVLAALLAPCSATAVADPQSNASMILELNDSTLNSTLAIYPFFILDCYEPGCDPCQRMNATLSELSLELGGQAAFGRINAKENSKTAEAYNVTTTYPTLLIFKNGTLVQKDVGFGSKAGIVGKLQRLNPNLNTSLVSSAKSPTAKTPIRVQKNCSDLKKLEKPMMEAFVVSYCPFGLQMQRVLSGIVDQIPALSQNIKVRYIVKMADGNVSSMHGQKESDENLRQICLREEQPAKYWPYISCFPESGNSSQCLKTAKIDEVKLNSCLADDKRVLKYARIDFNITQQFDITGSPTLLMNDEIVSESDFGGRTEQAVKNLLCCGFSTEPDFCSINLSTEKEKAGFTSKEREQQTGQAKVPASLKTIPLANVGENNPALPMLVADQTMAKAIKKYPVFVLMGFADWCGYCQTMNATILELSKQLQGQVAFGVMNAEKNNETAEKYNLVSYPRLLIFRNGTLVSTQTGYKSTSQFASVLKGLVPGLDESRSKTTLPVPSVAPQRPGIITKVKNDAVSGNDTALRYLDKVLEAAAIRRTAGNTVNVFIININNLTLQEATVQNA
jgi:thioredoxin 1